MIVVGSNVDGVTDSYCMELEYDGTRIHYVNHTFHEILFILNECNENITSVQIAKEGNR